MVASEEELVGASARPPIDDRAGRKEAALDSENWVTLREHVMNPSLLSMDGGAIALLNLEAELQAQDIDVSFDPYRPGEGAGWSRSVAQPIELLVRETDLERAEEIAALLDSEDAEYFDDLEEESEADDADDEQPREDDDTFDGWSQID